VDGDKEKHIGDPTETAIVLTAYRNGIKKEEAERMYPRLAEIPFDSDRKAMSTVNRIDGKNVVIVKGAFDVLASKCVSGDIRSAEKVNEQFGNDALRVIAIACKEIDEVPSSPTADELESGLTLMGLLGMIDPPRPEAQEAVKLCRKAGIKPVMITGDHVNTASAIARELGIFEDGDEAVTGRELTAMSDDELYSRVERISVYARVSPEDKIRIVKAWQKKGHVVAMTGDGVNDAPALKAADIGCAMGITGTDVAKGASDMTLTDDNFATIVHAVKEGRGIYDNIKKAVSFLLGTNIGEILTVFFAMILWRRSPLLPIQLLWINLVTDSLPAIALGMEAVEDDVMTRKPRHKDENIFAHGLLIRVLLQGFMFAALTLIGFRHGENVTGLPEGGRTMAFIILALTQIVHSFNMRSDHSLLKIGPFSNPKLNWAALVSVLLMVLVVFIPPVAKVFGLITLPDTMYIKAAALAFVPVPVPEAQMDRFLFKLNVPFPGFDELKGIIQLTTTGSEEKIEAVTNADEITNIQNIAREIPIAEPVLDYALRIVMATHPEQEGSPHITKKYVHYGSSPRGAQAVVSTARIRALLSGRYNVSFEDIQSVAFPSLRHRIFLNFDAVSDEVTPDALIEEILKEVKTYP
jgi:Ca2+-transporting ATPase